MVDLGGLGSFILAILLVIFLALLMGKRPEDIKKLFEKLDFSSALIMSTLIGVAVASLWLCIRVILLFFHRYLFEENYAYNQYDLFQMVAYALAMQLSFTLFKIVRIRGLKEIVKATIQAVLIGILLFLPNARNSEFLGAIGGGYGFALIMVSMSITLVALVFADTHIKEPK